MSVHIQYCSNNDKLREFKNRVIPSEPSWSRLLCHLPFVSFLTS